MISLIICSRQPDISARLKENIARSIGTTYELIVIDNAGGQHSIFSAYDLGVTRSRFPILCFMHDDIHFHSEGWGERVIEHFQDPATMAIGIAGTPYYPRVPGSWWAGGLVNETLVHETTAGPTKITKTTTPGGAEKTEVVVLDGLWLCIRKKAFENIRFDKIRYSGFHFYDMDICMQIYALGGKLKSISDISIQHSYTGKTDRQWVKNAAIFYKKWKKVLPATVVSLTGEEQRTIEYRTLGEYARILRANGIPGIQVITRIAAALVRHPEGVLFLPALLWKCTFNRTWPAAR